MAHLQQAKVLVVDDVPEWREVIVRHLQKHVDPAQIFTAGSDAEARGFIAQHFFHAAILDIRLEHENTLNDQGMGLLKTLYDQGESTGVIMVTGFGTPERVRNAWREYNAVDFLEKEHFRSEMLIAGLEESVSRSEKFLEQTQEHQRHPTFLSRVTDFPAFVQELPYQTRSNLFEVIRVFVQKLAPLKVSDKYEQLAEDQKEFLFSSKYWSRYKGGAVAFHLGSRQRVEAQIQRLPFTPELVERFTRQDISGIVYPISDVSVTDFQE